ncbi:MAG: hypothetical protein FJ276_31980 [Planctomycetes bacterium]|nr:hypothetical protein [Planctomycetota bacterium]
METARTAPRLSHGRNGDATPQSCIFHHWSTSKWESRLNVIQRPDGSLDPEVERLLAEVAAWMKVNSPAIHDTRPWLIYGEGATQVEAGHFKEDFAFTARDIRFTQRGETLYAIALGWPEDGRLQIRSLGKRAAEGENQIDRVELLGHTGELAFTQTADGLQVTLPAKQISPIACTLKITGRRLQPPTTATGK